MYTQLKKQHTGHVGGSRATNRQHVTSWEENVLIQQLQSSYEEYESLSDLLR